MARTLAAKFYADNYRIPMPTAPSGGVVMVRDFKFTVAATTPGTLISTGAACLFDATAGWVAGDKLYLCPLAPGDAPGFQLLNILIDIPVMDSGTSLVLQLGDSVAADTYVTTTLAGALGQAASPGRISSFSAVTIFEVEATTEGMVAGCVRGSLPVSYNPAAYATPLTQDNLILTAQTGGTTAALGVTIKGTIWYTQIGIAAL